MKTLFNSVFAIGILSAAAAASAESCSVPEEGALAGKRILYSALGAINVPNTTLQGKIINIGELFEVNYGKTEMHWLEYEDNVLIPNGDYTYTVTRDESGRAVSGTINTSFEYLGVDFSAVLTLSCRNDISGIYTYTPKDRTIGPASFGRYVLVDEAGQVSTSVPFRTQ